MKNLLMASAAILLVAAAVPASAHETDRFGNPIYQSDSSNDHYMRSYHARVAHRRELRQHERLHAQLNAEHEQSHADGGSAQDHADTHDALEATHAQYHRDHPGVPDNH
jgi:hypothetical protein